jgi:uncharacterized protein YbaR (Trm112 family)
MDEKLLRVLACPVCKGDVAAGVEEDFLVCFRCKLKYPVIDEIPIMLADDAFPLGESDDG